MIVLFKVLLKANLMLNTHVFEFSRFNWFSFQATHSFLNQASSRRRHNLSEFVARAYLDEVKSEVAKWPRERRIHCE